MKRFWFVLVALLLLSACGRADMLELSSANFPPADTPYLIEGESGNFWLVHTPAGEIFAFVPVSPEYKDSVNVDECRYTWSEAVSRFVDPCSGDEWELDGRLNVEHSTELWSNRGLDRYEVVVEEGLIRVNLDEPIAGTAQ